MSGRSVFLSGLVLLIALFGDSVATRGLDATWQLWGVPTMTPAFADLRTIAAETTGTGDRWGRAMNYPAIWTLAGITPERVPLFGWGIAVLFVVALCLLPVEGVMSALGLLAAVAAPAVILGLERGNNDLVVFCLVVVGLWLEALPLVAAAITLKLYPALAALGFGLCGAAWGLGLGVVYTVALGGEAKEIIAKTPQGIEYSYGTGPHWGIGIGIVAVGVGLGMLVYESRVDRRVARAFCAGAAVYCGTFLLGRNWDYRMVFLLLTVPYLAIWRIWLGNVVLIPVLGSMWSMALRLPFWADEACNWVVLFGLALLLPSALRGTCEHEWKPWRMHARCVLNWRGHSADYPMRLEKWRTRWCRRCWWRESAEV